MFTSHCRTPSMLEVSQKWSFWIIVLLRITFLGVITLSLAELIELGTSSAGLLIAGILGTACASTLAFSSLTTRGFITAGLLTYAAYEIIFSFAERTLSSFTAYVFGTYIAELHTSLFLLVFAIGGGAAWLFWRFRHWLTLEILGCVAIAIYLLAGHRNYRLDTPRLINTLAWNLNVDELSVLVLFGAGLSTFLLIYLFVATMPSRPSPLLRLNGEAQKERTNWVAWGALIFGVATLLVTIARQVYSYNVVAAGSRIANGVGQAKTNPGLSPLGFHSALGATNQPSALVRLEGDYRENPFTPMMYLREQALSQFNGHEMVVAERTFDPDVTNTTPQEPFEIDPDTELGPRVALRQSMYLLTEHKLAFAVDFPISVKPLKNPNPGRFKAAFQAYSMAPAFPVTDLSGAEIGDPRWPGPTRDHYLEKHTDPRYQALADSLTEGVTDPLTKVTKFVDYINENATYTLEPNHDVKPNDDPVAPFLFGDMRGYCVHFAHAMVYLLRAAGIPSRIATGYLTDLSQAKDGHILLRMSDRHAWAEVFLAGKGWVPFDIHPAKVESHGESPVDQKFLEELMASLDPPEEQLPKNIAKNEPGMEDPNPFWERLVPSMPVAIGILLFFVLLPLIAKSYLRFGWMLPGSPEKVARRLYRAALSRLFDLGMRRLEGETRIEFERRVCAQLGPDALSTTESMNYLRFAAPARLGTSLESLHAASAKAKAATKQLPRWQRTVALLSPASVLSYCLGRKF